ncbi:type II secretion system protein [Candidatus Omnitrophota bacterium]
MRISRKSLVVSNKKKNKASLSGFTLIELIVTIVVLGLVLIPLGLMCGEYMNAIVYSRDSGVAENLAKVEMAKVNNLAYDDAALSSSYDTTTSSYEGYPYDLRRKVNSVSGFGTDLKEVEIWVYPAGETTDHLTHTITYLADASFGTGSKGGDVAIGDEIDYLVVSDGTISGTDLQDVTLQNTGDADITVTGVIISFTGASGIKLKTVTMDSAERWSGTKGSGSTVTFDTNFTLTANTAYANTGLFGFSKDLTSVTSLVFIMSDSSQSSSYSW